MTIAPGLMAELLVNERAKETTGEFDQAFRNVERRLSSYDQGGNIEYSETNLT